jgi:hypothetical protein
MLKKSKAQLTVSIQIFFLFLFLNFLNYSNAPETQRHGLKKKLPSLFLRLQNSLPVITGDSLPYKKQSAGDL